MRWLLDNLFIFLLLVSVWDHSVTRGMAHCGHWTRVTRIRSLGSKHEEIKYAASE